LDELKRARLRKGIIQELRHRNNYHGTSLFLVDIYLDMLLQREVLEHEIEGAAGDKAVLQDVLANLDADIKSYRERLCLLLPK